MSGDDIEFALAGPADEPDIRRLVGEVAMPGAVAIRFAREPDYFLGTTTMGDVCQVLVARHRPSGVLAGFMCRTERPVFLNGVERRIGTIGQIRIAPGFRGRWLLHRGLPRFRELGDPDLLYVGVIARDNPRARGVLAGGRSPGQPAVRRLDGMTTCAIVLRRRRRRARTRASVGGLSMASATADELPAVVDFVRRQGAGRQLYPAYRVEDLVGGQRLRGLTLDDVLVARRAGSIVGVVAAWDQLAFKQDVVAGYGPSLARLRPLYDLAARAVRVRPLPRPGETLRAGYLAMPAIEGDDPVVFGALLEAAADRAVDQGMAFLTVGLCDRDPLLPVATRRLHVTYRSDLFVASWATEDPTAELDGRPAYVEVATL